jgi:hypothetical protein
MNVNIMLAVCISHTFFLFAVENHLSPFALWTAFPSSDYYDDSVTMSLATFRRS